LLSMLAHSAPVTDISINHNGNYMATSGSDRQFKIWDVRTYKCLKSCRIHQSASKIAFSQRGLLALAIGDTVQIYKDCCTTSSVVPYMSHRIGNYVVDLEFCPFEDVLGIGHQGGFTSTLIPGAGEPNFDALENNPFQTKSQRREAEVKALLEKIQPEMISLDVSSLNVMDKANATEMPKDKELINFAKNSKNKNVIKEEERKKKKSVNLQKVKLIQMIVLKMLNSMFYHDSDIIKVNY